MNRSSKGFIFVVILWLHFIGVASAHKMNMIQGDLTLSGQEWTANVWIEGWALYPDEGPLTVEGDPREPGVTGLDWIMQFDHLTWRNIRRVGALYIKDTFEPRLAGAPLDFEVSYPDFQKEPPRFSLNQDGNALVHCRLSGVLPTETYGIFSVKWTDADETPLALTVRGGDEADDTAIVLRIESGGEPQDIYHISENSETTTGNKLLFIWNWIHAGFTHIIPKGLDHILFILGLFLLQPKVKPLLWQTSAFTVAHSITLALVVLGTITASSRMVESMIALSIAYIGIENLFVKSLKPWRMFFVFGLGLLHGMGFASVMRELDIPDGSLLSPLLGFNIGVEFGQIAVLLTAWALTFWAANRKGYQLFRKIASGGIAVVGLYWVVERLS